MQDEARKHILERIKNALVDNPFPGGEESKDGFSAFDNLEESLEVTFAKELQKVDGKFVFCIDNSDLILNLQQIISEEKWDNVFCVNSGLNEILLEADIPFTSIPEDFSQMQVAITSCEYLIARFGSVMVSSAQISGRRLNVYPPVHIIIAQTSQLVTEIEEAFIKLEEKYKNNFPSMVSLITGPSRTADIEKTLVLGAHGPKELYVFLVDDLSI